VSAGPLGYQELNNAMREMWEALSIELPFREIIPLPRPLSNLISSPSPAIQAKKIPIYYIKGKAKINSSSRLRC
jgi:hypothetical protein